MFRLKERFNLIPTDSDVKAARRFYRHLGQAYLAGGLALEAHERVSLLTVAADLRPFSFHTSITAEDFETVVNAVKTGGLHCGVVQVKFCHEIKVNVPSNVIDAFLAFEASRPLKGLGVAKSLIDFRPNSLGEMLGYPECCVRMDEETKSLDRSEALRMLIDSKGSDYPAVIAALNEGCSVTTPETQQMQAWHQRFDLTRQRFPFAIHTACDACLTAGKKSPTAALSCAYEAMTRGASDVLYRAVVQTNRVFKATSGCRHT